MWFVRQDGTDMQPPYDLEQPRMAKPRITRLSNEYLNLTKESMWICMNGQAAHIAQGNGEVAKMHLFMAIMGKKYPEQAIRHNATCAANREIPILANHKQLAHKRNDPNMFVFLQPAMPRQAVPTKRGRSRRLRRSKMGIESKTGRRRLLLTGRIETRRRRITRPRKMRLSCRGISAAG